jgi:hypothetical protein
MRSNNTSKDIAKSPLKSRMNTRLAISILLVILMTTTCSDDVAEPTNEMADLSGVWELTTTVGPNTCGMEEGSENKDWIVLIQCDNEVSIIMGNGLWGTGLINGDRLDFTGTEFDTDDTGCLSTRISRGNLSGSATELEGSFTTNISFDADSCGIQPGCAIETTARLTLIEPYRSSCIDRDTFGDPAHSEYILPWPVGKSYVLNNSYCLPVGHPEQQAYDFLIPIGQTIVAARAGVVRQVKEDSPDDGRGTDHNHIMIEHEDGTVGFYAHLKQMGVLVSVGENVESGQSIALAGHSGTTDVVHLHFGVYGNWPPVEGDDRAINFRNMEGPVDCRNGLVNGATYTAK